MKRLFILLFITIFSCHTNSTYPWFDGSLEELQTITGSKPIMIEFYTDS